MASAPPQNRPEQRWHTGGVSSEPSSVFDRLQGRWTFVREIPGYASARGEARIVPEGEDAARYEESAEVALIQGSTLHATQCYLYHRWPAVPNGLEILFCESRELFHHLAFEQGSDGSLEAHARFLCAADEYVSDYSLDPGGRLHVQHIVRGPKKNYQVNTIFVRQSDIPGSPF